MLVLSRKVNESIIIDGRIKVTIAAIRSSTVRLGITAPPDISILREEIQNAPVSLKTSTWKEASASTLRAEREVEPALRLRR
jgi:carbon storage regulator CsrA